MDELAILSVVVAAILLIILIEIIRSSLLDLYANATTQNDAASHQPTPKRTILELITLVDLNYEEKISQRAVYINHLKEDHFLFYFIHLFTQKSSKPARDYPQQLQHCVFAILHLLSLLTLVAVLVMYLFPRISTCASMNTRSDCLQVSQSRGKWSLQSLHNRFCDWDNSDNRCVFRPDILQFDDSIPLLLFHLILIATGLAILNYLFSFLSREVTTLFKHYLFTKSLQYQHSIAMESQLAVSGLDYLSSSSKKVIPLTNNQYSLLESGANKRLLLDDNDELICLQTSSSLLLRGIRLSLLQRRIDFVRPLQEWEFLLNKSKAGNHFLKWDQRPASFISHDLNCLNYCNLQFQLLQFWLYSVAGNPMEGRSFLNHCQQHHDSLILRKLLTVRALTTRLRNQLRKLPTSAPLDYREVDLRLLQYFLIFWFNGLTREILQLKYRQFNQRREESRLMAQLFPLRISNSVLQPSLIEREAVLAPFTSCEMRSSNRSKSGKLLLASVVVAVIVGELVALLYYLPSSSNSNSNTNRWVWVWTLLVSYEGIYQIWSLPMRSLFYSRYLPQFIDSSYSILLSLLPSKLSRLLAKDSHYLTNVYSVLQFFHPAVRLARAFPASAISRALLSLHDFDLPVSQLQEQQRKSHPMYELWRLDYSNLHPDIWSDDNPLLRYRLQLLWENWKIRGFYCLSLVASLSSQAWRGCLHLFLLLPLPLQRLVMEVYLSWFSLGSALLLSYLWTNSSGLAGFVLVMVVIAVSLLQFFDVCFGWTAQLWKRYFDHLLRRNQEILKYRKKLLKRKVTSRKPVHDEQKQAL